METQSYNQQTIDISEKVMAILKTVLLLEKAYAGTYIQRILTGNSSFGWKNEGHKRLETFGELGEEHFSHIDDLINFLVKQEMLSVEHPTYGTIAITDKGREWMNDPQKVETTWGELKKSWYQVQLIMALRELRKESADQKEKAPFELFTNYTMEVLAEKLPQTEADLKAIPGMEELDSGLRLMILAQITRIAEKKEIDDRTGIFRKAYSPSHQKVKEMFLEGGSLDEIAAAREIAGSTVIQYLETLHEAGEVDLVSWIEQTIDPAELEKGAEYFRQASLRQLTPAHEALGLEYDVLRLCRFYAESAEKLTRAS